MHTHKYIYVNKKGFLIKIIQLNISKDNLFTFV